MTKKREFSHFASQMKGENNMKADERPRGAVPTLKIIVSKSLCPIVLKDTFSESSQIFLHFVVKSSM